MLGRRSSHDIISRGDAKVIQIEIIAEKNLLRFSVGAHVDAKLDRIQLRDEIITGKLMIVIALTVVIAIPAVIASNIAISNRSQATLANDLIFRHRIQIIWKAIFKIF